MPVSIEKNLLSAQCAFERTPLRDVNMKEPFRCSPKHEPEVLDARLAANIKIAFSRQVCIDGARIMSRHADANEIARVAEAIRRMPAQEREKIDAICSDSMSSIYLLAIDSNYRIEARSIANFLAELLFYEFGKPIIIYVFDKHGLIGIMDQLRAE